MGAEGTTMTLKNVIRSTVASSLIGWNDDGKAYKLTATGWEREPVADMPTGQESEGEQADEIKSLTRQLDRMYAELEELRLKVPDEEVERKLALLDRLLQLDADRKTCPTQSARDQSDREFRALITDERIRGSIH